MDHSSLILHNCVEFIECHAVAINHTDRTVIFVGFAGIAKVPSAEDTVANALITN